MAINQRYYFGKNQKLKSRKMIQQLFAEGNQYTVFPLRVVWIHKKNHTPLQMGVSVSSRHFKRAVDRNRIKRQIREAYRLQKNSLEEQLVANHNCLFIFLMFIGKERPEYKELFEACTKIIHKLMKYNNELAK